jgi:hypothetical protein
MGQGGGSDHSIRSRHRPPHPLASGHQFGIPVGLLAGEGQDPTRKQLSGQHIPTLLQCLLATPLGKPSQAMQDFGFNSEITLVSSTITAKPPWVGAELLKSSLKNPTTSARMAQLPNR